jgi:hypothetical protein
MNPGFNLLFQYFFTIGVGVSTGIAAIFFPGYLLFRFAKRTLDKKGWA